VISDTLPMIHGNKKPFLFSSRNVRTAENVFRVVRCSLDCSADRPFPLAIGSQTFFRRTEMVSCCRRILGRVTMVRGVPTLEEKGLTQMPTHLAAQRQIFGGHYALLKNSQCLGLLCGKPFDESCEDTPSAGPAQNNLVDVREVINRCGYA